MFRSQFDSVANRRLKKCLFLKFWQYVFTKHLQNLFKLGHSIYFLLWGQLSVEAALKGKVVSLGALKGKVICLGSLKGKVVSLGALEGKLISLVGS